MKIKSVGLITYHHPHLKTDQVLQRLLGRDYAYIMYALPFTPRKARDTLIRHRPEQSAAVAPEILAAKHEIPYVLCEADTDIDDSCDVYVILGAGILSAECVKGKKILNGHPGIIPSSRGLDSFKWAIHEMKPMGVTLHYIDAEVDAGEVVSVIPTNVYRTDTIATLARRHYENEIDMVARFDECLAHPSNPFTDVDVGEAHRRMPRDLEAEVEQRFTDYLDRWGK